MTKDKTQEALSILNRVDTGLLSSFDNSAKYCCEPWFLETIRKALEETQWQPIETAPKDGTELLILDDDDALHIGSWRVDEGFSGDKDPLWLDNSYNDFTTGYESLPLRAKYWMHKPTPPKKED